MRNCKESTESLHQCFMNHHEPLVGQSWHGNPLHLGCLYVVKPCNIQKGPAVFLFTILVYRMLYDLCVQTGFVLHLSSWDSGRRHIVQEELSLVEKLLSIQSSLGIQPIQWTKWGKNRSKTMGMYQDITGEPSAQVGDPEIICGFMREKP